MSPKVVEREDYRWRFRWSVKALALLGRVPDAEAARRLGCDRETVRCERLRRGIAPFEEPVPPFEWTDEKIALLGTATDREIGEKLGLHQMSVGLRRRVLGIPPFRPAIGGRKRFRWTAAEEGLLGAAADWRVAKRLGISRAVVGTRRRQLGIAPFRAKPERVCWTEEMLSRLGRESDRAIAGRYGLRRSTVARKRIALGREVATDRGKPVAATAGLKELLRRSDREVAEATGFSVHWAGVHRRRFGLPDPRRVPWTANLLKRLGKEPDAVLAARMGVSEGAVRYKRRLMGIRPARPWQSQWTPQWSAFLGKVPDAELARRMGISIPAVRQKRLRLGIPKCPRRR